MSRRLLRALVTVSAIAAAFAGLPVAAADLGLPPVPAADPFYAQPNSLTGASMGDVIDSRPVDVFGVPAHGPLTAWQLKYVSQDTQGTPWTTTALVLKLAQTTATPKLVAFQPWIDALDSRCNPSYQLRAGLGYLTSTGMLGEMPNLASLLDRGYTVVVPDYLGPHNQFAAGYVEGRNTLDGIRAAENFAPAGLSGTGTPVGLFGYSGGARGTEFAAELAPKYAPELNIRGVAAGGLPTDMGASAALMNGGLFAGIDISSAFGIARAYPELNIPAYFKPGVEQQVSGLCQTQIVPAYAYTHLQDYTVGGSWPLGEPAVARVLETLRAGRYGTPAAPLYLFSGADDQIAPAAKTRELVEDYRARGVDVTYAEYPGTEHVLAQNAGSSAALAWLAEHMD
ncbi:lipase family protein [Nocardia terpenica]|uniref:Lipase n=1 Tax=Nocardia terpenica TaxID=455432 RepID=A0A6G9Z9N0_9NOCA|nr:lipase family protein [Nocardia terpenica]QIS22319.1 hypothetical protein F6W96_32240 [Nocardia terpenica]